MNETEIVISKECLQFGVSDLNGDGAKEDKLMRNLNLANTELIIHPQCSLPMATFLFKHGHEIFRTARTLLGRLLSLQKSL